ncbi:MAG: aldo/keto reductase [Betaproteobacteria bacterium]|nr:aldo/keto reductase [Betaproteobacteria bacterium]MDH3436588.1 aldo/keto reductase [Betaproteobacteria bacterium]
MAQPSIPTLSSHGAEIPVIGFGTSQLGNCAEIVASALERGYRHIDTAWKYGTEEGVGRGIRLSKVPRKEIFLTTKVSHEYLRADAFARSVDQSLERLQVDYVDLLLVHWPSVDNVPLAETMGALAKAKREGKARHVGVANFNIAMVDESMRLCPEPLCVLQAEYHPYLRQTKVLDFCRRAGLIFMAYCPLGRGRLFTDPVLAEIAQKRGKSIAQIALRWQVQQGNIAPIPRSSNPKHMAESLQVFDFSLTEEEMNRIHALARPDGRIANPKGRAPAWD